MIVEKKERKIQTEKIESQPNTSFYQRRSQSKPKNFLNLLRSHQWRAEKDGNTEMAIYIKELIKKYKEYENIAEKQIDGWQGKSPLRIVKKPDKIIVYKYQRPNKKSEPSEVKYEITKIELNAMIYAINLLSEQGRIKTKDISREYLKKLGITETDKGHQLFNNGEIIWETLFSWRQMHNKITIILSLLHDEGLIEYLGGRTRILEGKKKLDIQKVLTQ